MPLESNEVSLAEVLLFPSILPFLMTHFRTAVLTQWLLYNHESERRVLSSSSKFHSEGLSHFHN